MGLLKLTESERLEILNLHNNARIIKEQVAAAPAAATVPAAAAPTDDKSKIIKLQTILKTKYNADLGTSGPNKDGIDGSLGTKTLEALSSVMKSKRTAAPTASTTAAPATGTAAPAASTTAAPATGTAAPAASTTAAPATGTAAPAASTTAAPATQAPGVDSGNTDFTDGGDPQPQLSAQSQQALAGQLTPQQIRQQGRFDQRLARQARRNTRRAGQQEQ